MSGVQHSCLENSWICVCNSTAPKYYQNRKNPFPLPHWQVKSIFYSQGMWTISSRSGFQKWLWGIRAVSDPEQNPLERAGSLLSFPGFVPPARNDGTNPTAPAGQGFFYLFNMELRKTHNCAAITKKKTKTIKPLRHCSQWLLVNGRDESWGNPSIPWFPDNVGDSFLFMICTQNKNSAFAGNAEKNPKTKTTAVEQKVLAAGKEL